MSYRFAALCVTAFATHAMAEGASHGLVCPSGTELRPGREGKASGAFCVKVGSTPQNLEMHGPYVAFWPNGQKKTEGQYKDGYRSGLWTFYDTNGVKSGQTQFEANDYHGKRVQFHPNGAKKMEQTWVKGSREGVEATYTADGQKLSEVRYSADKPVVSK